MNARRRTTAPLRLRSIAYHMLNETALCITANRLLDFRNGRPQADVRHSIPKVCFTPETDLWFLILLNLNFLPEDQAHRSAGEAA